MKKRKKQRPPRPRNPYVGRWRTIGIVATMVVGVGVVLALNLFGPSRHGPAGGGSHAHPLGPHGGTVIAVDRDNRFHVEAVFDSGGGIRLYTFGENLSEPRPADARTLCAAVRGHGGGEEYAVMLRPDPQPGDPAGTASRFAGQAPPAAWQGHVRLVVWALATNGERFVFEIDVAGQLPEQTAAEKAAAAEAALYSTTAGKYGEADILANGPAAASKRYKGERTAHDDKTRVGDPVCPVSRTKPNPKFQWVVGGKTYLFCCPPCIDDFVRVAKERPGEVQDPEFYKQR